MNRKLPRNSQPLHRPCRDDTRPEDPVTEPTRDSDSRTNQRAPATPAAVLRERLLDELGLTQRQLAQAIDVSEPRLSMILHGLRPISAEIALRLGRVFDLGADYWLQVQIQHDLFHENQRLGGELDKLGTAQPEHPRHVAGAKFSSSLK